MIRLLLVLMIIYYPSISISSPKDKEYTVGIGDILEISILQPEQVTKENAVTPSGEISVPYIGSLKVKGKTISEIQLDIQQRLANGYLKYPIVTVTLLESRSRNFTISGMVQNAGSYPLGEYTTVLKAIAIAGGLSNYASGKVVVHRFRKDRPGKNIIKIDIKKVMKGDAEDVVLMSGDYVYVSD
ncbi:MAG: polysaccharide biosynthesis/export family protein [Spirochaetota bacterium]|nr:polysaccharide biosynthesis/export family protein [Spirochaetota bacterium]